jgi:anti-anti-sigma factor
MDFIRTENNGVVVYQVTLSRATVNDAMEFKQLLLDDVKLRKAKIVIDFSSCEFIDSTFLGVLVTSHKKASEYGGNIKLVADKPAVESMFEMTKVNRIINTFPTVDEALSSFN